MRSFQSVFLLFCVCSSAENIIVKLTNGRVQGIRQDHYLAFEGMPYAKAPIGELRFEPPQPYTDNWDGVWDAQQPGAVCMQWDHFELGFNKLVGDEDCLFVNVYTPSLNAGLQYPVVVHIHGGAYMFGNGAFWNPSLFSRRNFVFVTFNYRLGPLGFLSTESSVVPGNMGLKDQVMALKWVQQNIHAFGGDPEMVTLTGFSAGGASTHLHLMSNMSKGLFHRAIVHSGSALNPWVQAEQMLNKTKRLAIEVGCTSSSNQQDIIQCLKQKPASEIVNSVSKFLNFLYNPFSPFGAVVEGEHPGSFLVDKPVKLLKEKRVHNVPVIFSAAEMEGLYPAAEFYNELTIREINDRWNEFVPAILDYQNTVEESELDFVSQRIRSHYLGTSVLTKKTFHKFSKAVTDRLYLADIGTAVQLHQASQPVYFYLFAYKSIYGPGEAISHQKDCLGVAHGEDMLLLFQTPIRDEPYTDEEETMIESLLDMYESFSATGLPIFGETKLVQAASADSDDLVLNEISGPTKVVKRAFSNFGDVKFWSSLEIKENY